MEFFTCSYLSKSVNIYIVSEMTVQSLNSENCLPIQITRPATLYVKHWQMSKFIACNLCIIFKSVQKRRCTSPICVQSLCKVWILLNEKWMMYLLYELGNLTNGQKMRFLHPPFVIQVKLLRNDLFQIIFVYWTHIIQNSGIPMTYMTYITGRYIFYVDL